MSIKMDFSDYPDPKSLYKDELVSIIENTEGQISGICDYLQKLGLVQQDSFGTMRMEELKSDLYCSRKYLSRLYIEFFRTIVED